MTRCWFVDDHRADYPVTLLCDIVELDRAKFYRWATPILSDQYIEDEVCAIVQTKVDERDRRRLPQVTKDLWVAACMGPATTQRHPSVAQARRADHGRNRIDRCSQPQEMATQQTLNCSGPGSVGTRFHRRVL